MTQTPISVPAAFLNLDLELVSPLDLTPVADHLKETAFILHCGPVEAGHHLCAEPLIKGHLNADPHACTEHMLSVLEALAQQQRDLWQSCSARVFDYGYDGGLEENPLSTQLSPAQLARMAALGLHLRVTVYPYRHSDSAEDGDDDA